MSSNLLAGITFVNTKGSTIDMNNIHGSQNGVFVDGQSADNTINANNILDNVIDLKQTDYQKTLTPTYLQTIAVKQAILAASV